MASSAGAPSRTAVIAKRAAMRRNEPHGRRNVLPVALLVLGLIGVTLAHVWLRLQVVQMGYVLSTTSKLQSRLEQENRELKGELASLMSPERLEAMARKRLGMIAPEKGQVIVLP